MKIRRGPISAVPANKQLLSEKSTGAKFQINSLKTEGLVCFLLVVTDFEANLIYPIQGIKMEVLTCFSKVNKNNLKTCSNLL